MEEQQEEEKSIIWKVIIALLGIFLMLLLLSYMLLPFGMEDIVHSLIDSSTIKNNLVEEEINVSFENESYERLINYYNLNLEQEFKVCLLGYYNGTYVVTEVYEPVMYSQSFNEVVAQQCPENTLIALHSHPYRHCIASEQDLENLQLAKEANENAVIGVMCEYERFNFYV